MGKCLNCGGSTGILSMERYCTKCTNKFISEFTQAKYSFNCINDEVINHVTYNDFDDLNDYMSRFKKMFRCVDVMKQYENKVPKKIDTYIVESELFKHMIEILNDFHIGKLSEIEYATDDQEKAKKILQYQKQLTFCIENYNFLGYPLSVFLEKLQKIIDSGSPYIYNKQDKTSENGSVNKLESIANGIDFEKFCAEILSRNYFCDVLITPASNDYGVDIIATKNDVKYAIQCKFYSSVLNNSPVQEVSAGMSYYSCHVGVVLTNSTFTKNAIELAKKTNILLWDRDVLNELIDKAKTTD